jgi:Zn-dependent peptidase ImmA (M78 family)/transcriptional regulator with XRE-family HTH domain
MMGDKPSTVYGERIKEAREIRGFSQTTLSELVGVQRQSVSAFEKNLIKPSAETLFKIAVTTQFPNSFFLNDRPRGDGKRTTPISFRKLESSTKTARLQAEQYENLFADIYYYLKHYIDFFKPNIPFLGTIDYRTIKDAEIEELATKVRRSWGLGDGPIQHMTRLLENNGILIAPVKLSMTMDAFSTWHHDQPIIMLSDANKSCPRRRFNEAHELGHLILHSAVEEEDFAKAEKRKELERQANYFAGAFLFPSKSVSNEFFSCSIPALKKLKERWKLSIAAIAMRLYNLHAISKNQHKYIMIQLGSNRKKEPLDDTIPMENPTMVKKAFDILVEEKVLSIHRVIEDMLMPDSIFSMLTTVELPPRDDAILPFSVRQSG